MTADKHLSLGELIEEKRKALRPRLSGRQAAERAGLSEGRWRQIVKGYQAAGGGKIPVHGPAETVARMAEVVGVTPEELEEVGRQDAAEELRTAQADMAHWKSDQSSLDITSAFAELHAYLEASDEEWPDRPPTSALMLWSSEQMLEALLQRARAGEQHSIGQSRSIIERNATIDELRRQLGWPPILDNLRESGFYKPIEAAVSGPADRPDLAVAADEQESSIAGEQEQPTEP